MGFSLDCPMLRNGTPTERVLDPCPRVSSECLWCACGQTVWHTSGGYGSREKLLSRPCEASYGLPLGQPRGSSERTGLNEALQVAFNGGAVTGLLVVGLGLLGVAGYFGLLYANAIDKSNLSHVIHPLIGFGVFLKSALESRMTGSPLFTTELI